KDEFITTAAHELKTPLISISGYTDYILMKYKEILNPEIGHDLLIVQRNIERLQTLMNQLLDVMKIDSQKMQLNKELTNVPQTIHDCINELSYLIKEKNHEVICNFDDDFSLLLDPDRIFQVFSNLLSNAIKFTPHNGKIEISAEKDEQNNEYVFKVKDNGVGLKDTELERLFKKFEIVKQANNEEYNKGTGLGLYISKGFIQAHGGKIWAGSEGLDKGTTIYFTLPL
ncbi:MAG: sensor histidine kinase, partial [Candidatus Hermodarchaeota archaeon]